eukprot:TRINITY_DN2401_c0_g4_i2.p1 TRINITY_DN2401_c0_g4~~TRINITY_DN2401_c0_g4_i2.p1  ORF type:complete len:201 (-),score=28.68 TRINITY_DN2401_c0_g4_i2:83-685(-)
MEDLKQNSEQTVIPADISIEEALQPDKEKALEWKDKGNTAFGHANYQEALDCYTNALTCSPLDDTENRAVYLSNRAACHIMMQNYNPAITDCTEALVLRPEFIRALERRARAYEEVDKLSESLEDWAAVLKTNPAHANALKAVRRLEPIVKERQERQKEEMLGKLKDLGNTLLGKFGLSLDNFKATKDPNTGSYSISFGQ